MRSKILHAFVAGSIIFGFAPRSLLAQTDFWRPSRLTNHTILSVAIDPHGHIFAGTADSGVFRSTDSGDHWSLMDHSHDRAEALAITQDSSILVGYSPAGILRSTDDGTTWSLVGFLTARVSSIYVTQNGEIFTGVLDIQDSVGGLIYRSTDNGKNWIKANGGLTNALIVTFTSLPTGEVLAGSLVENFYVDKPPPNQWFFYGGIYKSPDGSDKWLPIGLNKISISSILITSHGNILAGSYGSGVFRSTDNGSTWIQSNNGLTGFYQQNIRAMMSLPNGQTFIVTLGGFFSSTDDGNHWTQQNNGLTDTSVFSIALDSMGFIYVGTGNGVFRSVRSVTSGDILGGGNPLVFSLSNNYPNPFNSSTTIEFSLSDCAFVTLKIYNRLGQEVTTLLSENLTAGFYRTRWYANGVPSGVYFCSLKAGSLIDTRKLVLLR